MAKKILSIISLLTTLWLGSSTYAATDKDATLLSYLKQAMLAYHVPVVGYAIINNYEIVDAKTVSIDPKLDVSQTSLFQAASISKSMTAYGALKLVDEGKLDINQPANRYLTSWKIAKNQFNSQHPVYLRNLMDMTSGLSVSGFAGYQQGKPLPTELDILNGTPPANNQAIAVFYAPGSKYFYSGGAFQVLEQVVADQTKQDFNAYMNTILSKHKFIHKYC